MRETGFDPWFGNISFLKKEMAIYSSTIVWKIPWTEEPGRLESIESQRVRHDCDFTSLIKNIISFFERKYTSSCVIPLVKLSISYKPKISSFVHLSIHPFFYTLNYSVNIYGNSRKMERQTV